MKTNFYTQNSNVEFNRNQNKAQKTSKSSVSFDDSRISNDPTGCSKEAASAARASAKVSFKGIQNSFSEKDINIAVTLRGYANIKSNTRSVWDFRTEIKDGPWKPQLVYNRNGDERYKGETTAIIFPIDHSDWRNTDNMTILISGRIPKEVASGLVDHLANIGVLNVGPSKGKSYYVDDNNPYNFMSNFKIKSSIARYLTKAMEEYERSGQIPEEKSNKPLKGETNSSITNSNVFSLSSINVLKTGRIPSNDNSRTIRDYSEWFTKNNNNFTVLHDEFNNKGQLVESTAILIPSIKHKGDFITISIDGKTLSYEQAKNLVNSLVAQKIASPDNPRFKNAILEFFSNN